MLIRDIRPGEGATAAKLAAESPTAAHWTAADYEAAAAGRNPNQLCLVAEREPGAICGFLHAAVAGAPTGTRQGAEAELLNVVVAASDRRQGVAGALLEHGCEGLRERGAGVLWLEVRESNAAAIAFYRARGFEQQGRRKGYYRDPVEDALAFSLDFSRLPA